LLWLLANKLVEVRELEEAPMAARHIALAAGIALAASPALADHATSRGGGSSGGSSSGGGGSHPTASGHSSSSGGSSSSSGGSSSSSGSSSGGHSSSASGAQSRHPRPGTGHGYYGGRGGYGRGYGYGYGYGGYYPYWGGFYGSAWWPYDSLYLGYGGYGYGGYGYGGYGYGYGRAYGTGTYHYDYGDRGAVRVLVDQEDARVFVDGYYAGVVDDFDGIFQRLYISPGRHEIALKLDGYQTHRFRIYVAPGATLKIHYGMVKGSGPETVEDLAGDDRPPRDDRYGRRDDGYRRPDPGDDGDDDRPVIRDERPRGDGHGPAFAVRDLGRVRLAVRPEDASVYVDGQFKGIARQVGPLELPAGRHRIEIVRPGFRTEERDFTVEAGASRDVDVELHRP
jgi:hypothetical protein